MTDQYPAGTTATLLVQFTAFPGGPAADVTGLTVTVSPAGGGAAVIGPTSAGVVHESTGLYSYAWAIDVDQDAGVYIVEWTADGGVTASEAVEVLAGPTGWAPDYLTVPQLRNWERVDDDLDDDELAGYITAASRAIDHHCNRQFGKVTEPEQRFYTGRYDSERGRWIVDIDDVQDTTGIAVEVDGTTITDGTYTLEPRNAVLEGKAYTRLALGTDAATQPCGQQDEVGITAAWGWNAVPPPVTLAARLQSSRFAARRDSPYGIAGSPDQGSEMRLLARVDPDVAVSLRGYVRRRRLG